MASERLGHTLQPTALVHEAYMRLAAQRSHDWSTPAEYYRAAAAAMRRILIDHARGRSAAKRGGGVGAWSHWSRHALDRLDLESEEDCGRLLALDEALSCLEEHDPRAAEVVRLRFFAGLTVDKTADAMGQSRSTTLRDWEFARVWLLDQLERE